MVRVSEYPQARDKFACVRIMGDVQFCLVINSAAAHWSPADRHGNRFDAWPSCNSCSIIDRSSPGHQYCINFTRSESDCTLFPAHRATLGPVGRMGRFWH
jgi:hypothetical protein